MNKISCEICMDLIPLVQDQAASEDSRRAVEAHTAVCPRCRALLNGQADPEPVPTSVVTAVQKKMRYFYLLLLFLGLFLGICITQLSGRFFIVFVTPVIGMAAYGVYRWKALWLVPALLLPMYALSQLLGYWLGLLLWNPLGIFFWAALTIVFSDAGVLIAGLFHFGFRKEKTP